MKLPLFSRGSRDRQRPRAFRVGAGAVPAAPVTAGACSLPSGGGGRAAAPGPAFFRRRARVAPAGAGSRAREAPARAPARRPRANRRRGCRRRRRRPRGGALGGFQRRNADRRGDRPAAGGRGRAGVPGGAPRRDGVPARSRRGGRRRVRGAAVQDRRLPGSRRAPGAGSNTRRAGCWQCGPSMSGRSAPTATSRRSGCCPRSSRRRVLPCSPCFRRISSSPTAILGRKRQDCPRPPWSSMKLRPYESGRGGAKRESRASD